MGTWGLHPVPQETGRQPQISHCLTPSPNTRHTAADWHVSLGWSWRDRVTIESDNHVLNPQEAWWEENWSVTPKVAVFFNPYSWWGALIFPGGKPQVRQEPVAQEPFSTPHPRRMLQGPWKAAALLYSFSGSICCHLSLRMHLSPNRTVSKGQEGCWSTEGISGCIPGHQLMLTGSSSPDHWRKGPLCSLLYCILLATLFATEEGQKQRALRVTPSSGNSPAKNNERRDTLLAELQETWAALPASLLWVKMTLGDTSKTSSNWTCHMKNLLLFFSLWTSALNKELKAWTCEKQLIAATTQADFNIEVFKLEI